MGQKSSCEYVSARDETLVTESMKRHHHVDVAAMAEAEAAVERWRARMNIHDRHPSKSGDYYDWNFKVERTTADWVAIEAFVYFEELGYLMRTTEVNTKGVPTRARVFPGVEFLELKGAEYRVRWEKAGGEQATEVSELKDTSCQ